MVWALLLIPLVVALLLGYTISRSSLGQEAAWRNLLATTLFLFLILSFVFALNFLPHPWRDYAWLSLSIFFSAIAWTYIISWPRRKRRAGSLLWNLGRPSTYRSMLVAGGLFLISAILQTTMFFDSARNGFPEGHNSPEYYLSQAILYWSTAIYFFWAGLSRLELREKGIYFKFGLIEWQQIASYKWEGVNSNTLTVWLKQRFPFFPTRSWQIPVVHKATIERILAQNLQKI
jgi:hypothetical protein